MNREELDNFLEANQNISWNIVDVDSILFRNEDLPWYQADKTNATRVPRVAIEKLDEHGLLHQINKGFDVECITRITGYFAKTRAFNPGKIAELNDRHRVTV